MAIQHLISHAMSEAWHFTQRLVTEIINYLKSSFAIYGDLIHYVFLGCILVWMIFKRSAKYIFSKPLPKHGETGLKIKIPLGILCLKISFNSGKKGLKIKCGLSIAFISLKVSINPQSWRARPKVKLKFSFWLFKYAWANKGNGMRLFRYNISSNVNYRTEGKVTQIVNKSLGRQKDMIVSWPFMKIRRGGRTKFCED